MLSVHSRKAAAAENVSAHCLAFLLFIHTTCNGKGLQKHKARHLDILELVETQHSLKVIHSTPDSGSQTVQSVDCTLNTLQARIE